MESVIKNRPQSTAEAAKASSVYIFPDVMDEITFNAGWSPDKISVGVLVGSRFSDTENGDDFVEIEGFVAARHISGWDCLHQDFEQEWKRALAAQRFHSSKSVIVGWYLGTNQKTGDDPEQIATIHKTFFRHGWQVCVLVRGESKPIAFKLGPDKIQPTEVAVIKPSTFSSVI